MYMYMYMYIRVPTCTCTSLIKTCILSMPYTAVIFRYNVLSLVYLLLFIVSLLLPGPRLKSQRGQSLSRSSSAVYAYIWCRLK